MALTNTKFFTEYNIIPIYYYALKYDKNWPKMKNKSIHLYERRFKNIYE